MQRTARGLDVPQGTAGQEQAALKCFGEFLTLGNMNESSIDAIAQSLSSPGAAPSQNFYSLLTAFCIFLQTKTSARGSPLAKATAVGYLSQVVNLLRERYPAHLSDSKRIAKIREKMAAAIEERNLVAGVQTGEAPGCTLDDLRVLVHETAIKGVGGGFKSLHDSSVLTLMWHTFGRAIDTCFARKSQLSMAASGELFLHIARIKMSVVQGVSIYKSAKHWEQCMLHALGMLFVGASEPSSYVFPLVPHAAVSDLPGEKTYSQDEAIVYWESLEEKAEAFAYVGTTTREDQSVGKVLAGYRDPNLPCVTPTIATLKELLPSLEYTQLLTLRGQLFKYVSGFSDTTLNVDAMVLDAALASLLIHLEDVANVVQQEQAATGFASHYLYRFHEALDATNAALGSNLSLEACIGWGRQLRSAWETENFAQLGERCTRSSTVLAGAVTQMLSSIATMQRTLQKLVAMHEATPTSAASSAPCRYAEHVTQQNNDVVVEAHSLAGCFYNWYTLELWHTASQKKQQSVRADLKASVNIMIIAAGREIDIPAAPTEHDGVSYHLWKQSVWTLAEDLDKKTNTALGRTDGKGKSKTAGLLRKRWGKLRVVHRPAYDAICSAFISRKANGGIVDRCTPESHQWKQKDLES